MYFIIQRSHPNNWYAELSEKIVLSKLLLANILWRPHYLANHFSARETFQPTHFSAYEMELDMEAVLAFIIPPGDVVSASEQNSACSTNWLVVARGSENRERAAIIKRPGVSALY